MSNSQENKAINDRITFLNLLSKFDADELNEIIHLYCSRKPNIIQDEKYNHFDDTEILDALDSAIDDIYISAGFRKVKIFDRLKVGDFNSQIRSFGEYSHQRRSELWDKMPEYAYIPNGDVKKYVENAKEVWENNVVGLDDILEKALLHIISYCKTGKTRPLLLVGQPGCGKTTVAKVYAQMLDLECFFVNAPRMGNSHGLYGDAGTYKDADCGAVAEAMIITHSGNPVIIIDEIDKAGEKFTHANCNLQNEALNLLDEGAEEFRDNFLKITFNASYCPIVLTANEIDDISPPLADRCEIVRFPECDMEHIADVSKKNTIPKLLKKLDCEKDVMVDYRFVDDVVADMYKDGIRSIRAYQSVFENAISSAYLRSVMKEQRQGLCRADIENALNNTMNKYKHKIGFG